MSDPRSKVVRGKVAGGLKSPGLTNLRETALRVIGELICYSLGVSEEDIYEETPIHRYMTGGITLKEYYEVETIPLEICDLLKVYYMLREINRTQTTTMPTT